MNASLTLSVVVPAYGTRNGSLERAVRSILQHGHHNIEVLIVDDCTPDSSVKELADKLHVRYVRRGINGGVAAAQNTGVQASEGRYIMFLHSDDEFLLAGPWPYLEGGVVAGCLAYGSKVFPPPFPDATPEDFLQHQFYVHISAYVFDRGVLLDIPFDPHLRSWEDWDLLYRMAVARVPAAQSPNCLAVIRDDAAGRLSLSPHMAEALMLLYNKHSDIRSTRTMQSRWEYKIGRLLVLAGRPVEGRRWLLRALVHDPIHPRRMLMVLRLATTGLVGTPTKGAQPSRQPVM